MSHDTITITKQQYEYLIKCAQQIEQMEDEQHTENDVDNIINNMDVDPGC